MPTIRTPRPPRPRAENVGWAAVAISLFALLGTVVQHGPAWFRKNPPAELAPPEAAISKIATPTTTASGPVATKEVVGENGCRSQENLQICWGKAALGIDGGHVRAFNFSFPKAFASPPVVTSSIDVQSPGYAYAIYNSILDPQGYRGSIVEVQFRSNLFPVAFSYIAIGSAK